MSNHQTASLDFADRPAARCQTTRQAPEAVWPRRLSDLLAGLEDENTYEFAAWGIGTHPGAALIGEHPSFEGERIYGWTHVSTGSSATLPGGTVQPKSIWTALSASRAFGWTTKRIVDGGKFVALLA